MQNETTKPESTHEFGVVSDCTHTRNIPGHWEDNPFYDPNDEGYEGEQSVWVDGYDESTSEDVDLHHYRCTQCGLVRKY